MITEKDLLEAIKECEAEPITASKVGKLADFYIIYDHLFGSPHAAEYSHASTAETPIFTTNRGTEFLQAIDGKKVEKVLPILDELMGAIKALHERIYDRVIEKIYDL